MILLMDIGNSTIRWRSLTGQHGGDIRHRVGNMAAILSDSFVPLVVPKSIYVASVAGSVLNEELTQWCKKQWQQQPRFISAEQQAFGVTNGYRQPETLGVDRWLTLIAARQQSAEPVCIVDCGTAITIDAMDAEGNHQGGLILPGIALMRRVLNRDTDAIDVREINESAGLTPYTQSTDDAVAHGTLYAVVAAIDRVVAEVCDTYGPATRCLITGGGCEPLQPLLAREFEYCPELVLEGLARYADRN